MSTETIEAPAQEATEPEAQTGTTPEPGAPGAEVAVRMTPGMQMTAKMQYARMLAMSGLLPTAYRKQPANVLYAVEYGQMLGLQPMAAITGIHIIEGRPTASAGLISALVRRAGHKLRVSGNAARATCQIIRSDDPDYTYEVTWTLQKNGDGHPDAETAGLLNKDVWKKYASSMLKSRAITQCARDACEEALFGLHYTPEELGAEVDGEGNVIAGEIVADDPWATPAADTDQEWLGVMLADAAKAPDKAAAGKLWKATAAKHAAGECTDADRKRIEALITARVEELDVASSPPEPGDDEVVDAEIVEDGALDPEDPWATAVDSITGGEDADAAKADLRTSLKNGSITSERFQQVLAAIDARLASLGSAVAA